MGLSSVELWQRIAASQLASPLLCRTWAADAATALSATEAIDGQRVGEQLVSQGKLTQFQADTLLSDKPMPLVRNGYRILEPVDYRPYPAPHVRSVWSEWWAVAKTPTAPTLWMRWLTVDDLKQPALAQSNPALPRALQQSQIKHERLQSVLPPEMASGTLQVCVEPIAGNLLTSTHSDGRGQSVDSVIALMTDIAAALAPMHAAGLAHGRVIPDRIGVNEAGYHLLRDPLCGATMHMAALRATGSATKGSHASPAASGLLATQLGSGHTAAHFMAPEFLLPAQVATPQSDLYSLGCVAWLLLTGEAPFSAKQADQILAAHAEQPLDLSRLPKIPEPLSRCLFHCLAKNPHARFETAGKLVSALQEAGRIVAKGPSKVASLPKPTAAAQPASKPHPVADPKPNVEAKTVEAKTVEAKTVEAKTVEAKTVEARPVESKPDKSKPVAESKPAVASKPEVKPIKPTAVDPKPTAELKFTPQAKPSEKTATPASKPTSPAQETVAAKTATASVPADEASPAKPTAAPAPAPAKPVDTTKANPAPTVTASTVTASIAPPSTAPSAAQPATVAPVPAQPTQPQAAPAPTSATAIAPAASTAATPSTAASAAATSAAQPQKRLAQPGKPPGRRSPVRKAKKSKSVNWLTPVIGGGALLVLVLLIVVMNGGLGTSGNNSANNKKTNTNEPPVNQPAQTTTQAETAPVDPLAEKFELVSDSPNALWAPPHVVEPIVIDLLPPGGQFFAAIRPARLMANAQNKQLLSLLDPDLAPLWKWITDDTGLAIDQIEQVVIAAFPSETGAPQSALRVKLKEAQPLSQLKAKWRGPTDTKVKDHSLMVSGPLAYYIQQQPLLDSQSVSDFAVGPTTMMREVAELQGAPSALTGQMEQLLVTTDKTADINLLVNPVFFYTEGRAWLDKSPPRFRAELERWVPRDMRAFMLTTALSDPWYYELRLVGATDRDAISHAQKLIEAKAQLAQSVESWFVNELPHAHWRAMANRYPNMLRALTAQTRIGTENGQAIINGYLPLTAAPNLIYASWMAVQPNATASTAAASTAAVAAPTEPPLTPEQILSRKITLTVPQTGIESIMQAVAEQANDKLPPGTKPLKFALDGPGFERSGITRNKEISGFEVKDMSVRDALTFLMKKGNPVQPLNDTKSKDQLLIWVLIDGDKPDKAVVTLTSRDAANTAGYKLPPEFAPAGS